MMVCDSKALFVLGWRAGVFLLGLQHHASRISSLVPLLLFLSLAAQRARIYDDERNCCAAHICLTLMGTSAIIFALNKIYTKKSSPRLPNAGVHLLAIKRADAPISWIIQLLLPALKFLVDLADTIWSTRRLVCPVISAASAGAAAQLFFIYHARPNFLQLRALLQML
jgi:hypothetical protein